MLVGRGFSHALPAERHDGSVCHGSRGAAQVLVIPRRGGAAQLRHVLTFAKVDQILAGQRCDRLRRDRGFRPAWCDLRRGGRFRPQGVQQRAVLLRGLFEFSRAALRAELLLQCRDLPLDLAHALAIDLRLVGQFLHGIGDAHGKARGVSVADIGNVDLVAAITFDRNDELLVVQALAHEAETGARTEGACSLLVSHQAVRFLKDRVAELLWFADFIAEHGCGEGSAGGLRGTRGIGLDSRTPLFKPVGFVAHGDDALTDAILLAVVLDRLAVQAPQLPSCVHLFQAQWIAAGRSLHFCRVGPLAGNVLDFAGRYGTPTQPSRFPGEKSGTARRTRSAHVRFSSISSDRP